MDDGAAGMTACCVCCWTGCAVLSVVVDLNDDCTPGVAADVPAVAAGVQDGAAAVAGAAPHVSALV
jgi:hypothetical protein